MKDSEAEVWACYEDGSPALAVKSLPGWRSVYCGSPLLPAALLRRIFHEAGVHIYCDSGDNLVANAGWIAMHTIHSGTRLIRLPEPRHVYDILSEKSLGEGLLEFQVTLPEKTTAIFALDP